MISSRLVLNEYPYYVADGIEHWCLWKLGGAVTEEEIVAAVDELKSNTTSTPTGTRMMVGRNNPKMEDVLTWVNPPHLQSIPAIDHAHILWLFHHE